MTILDQFYWLTTDRTPPIRTSVALVRSPSSSHLPFHWCSPRTIFTCLGLAIGIYVVYPTIFPSKKMFTRRPDKHTTGLVNLRNDCFANASLQALSSLAGLTEYLNEFLLQYLQLKEFFERKGIMEQVIEGRAGEVPSKKGRFDWHKFSFPLHDALADIDSVLQQTLTTSTTVSVWTFLHRLEAIFNSRISRSQHDAHELTMLVMETLEMENLKLLSILAYTKENLHKIIDARASDYRQLNWQVVEFPFHGLVLSKMQCTRCNKTSKPHFSAFLVMTLCVPQLLTSSVESLLSDAESERIDGYHCVVCRAKHTIAAIQQNPKLTLDDMEETITSLETIANGYINDDVSTEVEALFKRIPGQVVSTVVASRSIIKPPKIFAIHLSRSTFNGQSVIRNPCRVKFGDRLSLSIGHYHLELQSLAENGTPEEQTHSRVLTTDVNDVEDETVQREDFEEHGSEEASLDVTSVAGASMNSENTTPRETFSQLPKEAFKSVTSLNTHNSISDEAASHLNASRDQLERLSESFSQFDFAENDVYTYKLKSMIRHQGSHSQGHYEAYKRKPTFVKMKDGTIMRLSPKINRSLLGETAALGNGSIANDVAEHQGENHKSKISLMKQPEVIDSTVSERDVTSGLHSPREVSVVLPPAPLTEQLTQAIEPATKKFKKLSSVVKHPFWRISDSQVSETSTETVLDETSSVYMLYYERK
ncbi:hypothetical protein DICA3_F30372 [Diutina catenulata]